jgi:chlorobactene glucosyltransferase
VSLLLLAMAAPLTGMLLVAWYNLLTAPRLHHYGQPPRLPGVSVLVPARNEAAHLPVTLPLLLASDYPDLEILVLDDESTDGTAAIVETLATLHPGRIRLLRGTPPPEGWLGKNWACEQLARAAGGEVLLFCDADVRVSPAAVRRTVAALLAERADIVTALPAQELRGASITAAVPLVMHVAIAATLPLALLPRLRHPSTALANGQWLALRRVLHMRLGGHGAVRGEVVEDIALARHARRLGARIVAVVADRDVRTAMYADPAAMRAGFGKNLYGIAGGRPIRFLAVLALFLFTMLGPLVLPLFDPRPLALLPLGLLVAVRLAVAGTFHHGILPVLLHPFGTLLIAGIAVASARAVRSGRVGWKGRNVAPQRAG